MSTPPFLDPPPGTRRERHAAAHGTLAVLALDPPESVARQAPVLLVPGFTGSKEDFIAVLAPIAAAGHPVVAVDQRGQFESVEPGPDGEDPASYDATVLAEDVVALAAALGAGDRVHLVGHSFGGIVARAAVAAAPSRWVSLTLMSSGPGPVPHPAAENLGLLAKVLPDLDLATVWAAKAQLEAQAGVAPDPPETEAFLRRRFLANSPVALRRLADQLLSAPDSTYGIETLSLRVLVLNGDADDAWTPESQADYARRLGAEHVVVAGAGHSPAADAPAETAAALTAFWSAKG